MAATNGMPALGEDYQRLGAAEKQRLLWERICATVYGDGPLPRVAALRFGLDILLTGFLRARYLGRSMLHASDETPDGRRKLIHRLGSVARIEWIASGELPYTGLLGSSCPGLIRLSHAAPGPGGRFGFVPSIAIKLLVDGRPSHNLVSIPSLDGQGDNQDFFLRRGSTVLPPADGMIMGFLQRRFQAAIDRLGNGGDAGIGPLRGVAATDPDGNRAADPRAPYELIFEPGPDVPHDPAPQPDFRRKLEQIPADTVLYRVLAADKAGGPEVRVGDIHLRDTFVTSEYGDRRLFFQHDQWEPDEA
jgi:hypothetical protein